MFTVLLFALSFVVCIYLSIKQNKAYLFVLYELIYFFSPKTKWWGQMIPDISYSFYTVLVLIIVAFMQKDKLGLNNPLKIKAISYMFLMVLLYAFSSIMTVYPIPHAIAFDAFLTLGVLVFVTYVICQDSRSFHIIVNGYLVGASYLSFYIFQFGRNSGARVEYIGMPDAPDANGIAAALAPALSIALGYFWAAKNWKIKAIYAISGVFIANALVLINSRGAFLGASCGILYILWKLYKGEKDFPETKTTKAKIYVVLLVVAGLAGALTIADQAFIDRMLTITEEAKGPDVEKESGATRTEYWKAAWKMAPDFPFGAGRGGFEYYAPNYIPEHINTGGSKNRAVHSTWFEALTEIGYLGMLALILMVWQCYKMLRAVTRRFIQEKVIESYVCTLGITGSFISFLVTMTFVNRLRAEVFYWIVLFIAVLYKVFVLKPQLESKSSY